MSESAENVGLTTSPTGWERRRRIKQQQIIGAATQLFLEHGFGGVSMDAIVDTASVSKRTLYNYYESKEQLFLDVVQAQLGEIWPALEPDHPDVPLDAKLQRIAHDMLTVAMKPEPIALYRVMIAEAVRFPDLTDQFYKASMGRVKDSLAHLFATEGEEAGLDIDNRHDAADVFLDLLMGSALIRVVMGVDPPMEGKALNAHSDRAVRLFFRAHRA